MNIDATYSIYAVANFEDIEFPDEEADIQKVSVIWNGDSELSNSGFPMAWHGSFKARTDSKIQIRLTRLVARYDIKVDQTALKGKFNAESLILRNSASSILPFVSSSKATYDKVCDGDRATSADLNKMNEGKPVSWYMLENMQGTAPSLSSNSNPWAKVPSNAGAISDCATYLELEGSYFDHGITSHLTYRFYLGQDALKNFDVRRNTASTVTLTLSDEAMLRSSWKVERGTTEDNRIRELKLTPSDDDRATLRAGCSNKFKVKLFTHYYDEDGLLVEDKTGEALDNDSCIWSINGDAAYIDSDGTLNALHKGIVTVTAIWKEDSAVRNSSTVTIVENGIGISTGWDIGGSINL